MCVARHIQNTQINKFAIPLQYFKNKVSDDVHCLHVDKQERVLQIGTILLVLRYFDGDSQAFRKFPK